MLANMCKGVVLVKEDYVAPQQNTNEDYERATLKYTPWTSLIQ